MSYFRDFFIFFLVCLLGTSLFTTNVYAANGDFIQAVGKDLKYQGGNVLLKGTNFDNVPALGASIGSGNMSSIQITEADYQRLSEDGGNHARFGLSFNWYQSDPTQFFAMLDQHIAWARAHNIWIVLNMFTTPANCYEGYSAVCGIWASVPEQQELKAFWVDVAEHYATEPVIAGYDLLNEPNPQAPDYCTTWFNVASEIRDAVYAIAPNQLVFISACSDPGNSFRYRSPPFGTNIVYEVHDYTPIELSSNSSLTYPGTATDWFGTCTYNKSAFLGNQQGGDLAGCGAHTNLSTVYGVDWATSNNVPIYFGEWGATSSLNGYVQFHQDKAEIYTSLGVSSAHYTWKHKTIVTGGSDQWGIYANPLRLDEPLKLAAVQTSWASAVFPNFSLSTPTVTLTPLSPDPHTTTSPTLLGSAFGGSDPLSTVEFQLDGTGGAWTACTAADGGFNEVNEDFSCPTTTLSQGSHTIYVRATNSSGMFSSTATDAFVIDSVGPVTTVPALAQNPTYDTTPAFPGTASDAHGTVASVEYQIGDTVGSWSSCVADDGTFDEASETFVCTVSPSLNPGTHSIYFRSRDQLGSYSATTTNQSFVLSNDKEWLQTDWIGGSGQSLWSDETKFSSSSQINTATLGEISLSGIITSPWYNSAWNYRKLITIDHTQVSGGSNLTDFPVLINFGTDSDLVARALSNGNDLLFTSSDGTTKLSHEIEKYTSATGELQAWVKVPVLSATIDTQLYLYYGNAAAASQANATAVWTGNGYGGVWHLAQSPGDVAPQFIDSLAVNNGTATVLVSADQVAAKIDGGIDFASSNDWISMPNGSALRPTGAMTTSAWIKINSYSGNGRIFAKQGGGTARAWSLNLESADTSVSFGVAPTSSTMVATNSLAHPATGTWVYAVGTYEPSVALRVYVDGTESNSNTTSIPATQFSNNGFGPRIGMSVNNTGDFNGIIDEVRISSVVRTPGWIATEFANQNVPASFYSVSAQQLRVSYESSGNLVSSIFDTGGASLWGLLSFTANSPTNTVTALKVRTSNSNTMAGAADFSSCPTISDGTDLSGTACATDGERYVQYQQSLSTTDPFVSPVFSLFQLIYSRVNQAPLVSLVSLTPPVTSPISLQGTAEDADGLIANVEYQVDSTSGSWTGCAATDSTFNESSEAFTCAISLSAGSHTIAVRSTDNQSEYSIIESLSVTVTENQVVTTVVNTTNTSGSSTPTPPVCNASTPGSKAPWLYSGTTQSATSIQLYLTPAAGTYDHYVLRYGTASGDYAYGIDNLQGIDRVLAVSALQPNTTYFFSLRAGNQCAVGPWSNELQVKTGKNDTSTFAKLTALIAPDSEKNSLIESIEDTPASGTGGSSTESSTSPSGTKRHQLTLKLKDAKDQPVKGASVTIHSEPQEDKTDENGQVVFQNIESGQHTLTIAYEGTRAEQSLFVDEHAQDINISIKLEPANRNREYMMSAIIVVLSITLIGVVLFSFGIVLSIRESSQ